MAKPKSVLKKQTQQHQNHDAKQEEKLRKSTAQRGASAKSVLKRSQHGLNGQQRDVGATHDAQVDGVKCRSDQNTRQQSIDLELGMNDASNRASQKPKNHGNKDGVEGIRAKCKQGCGDACTQG
jgi:hypothetical protein